MSRPPGRVVLSASYSVYAGGAEVRLPRCVIHGHAVHVGHALTGSYGTLQSGAATLRIHIIGGSGSGKTTLGRQLSGTLGIPVHHLDDVVRVGGGLNPLRPLPERDGRLASILAADAWISEGIHVGWTEPILEAAELIVWLDHVPVGSMRRRLVVRFVRDAVAEARRHRGRARFLRFRDYAVNARGLWSGLRKVDDYGRTDEDVDPASESRAATIIALTPHRSKVVHCTQQVDVDDLVERLTRPPLLGHTNHRPRAS